ncbi:hypothetical protein G3N56_10225 [Desulfovibrio sulfodismutans]|uniref:Uncharacterized protein n=1 Tax=Desulfolutivibrio sulfodismutans TaxID=63561 RepID=A0A7K3NLN9_9BACT|nr:DUF6573 family protein [Desulfolutivibrio sulfodismutans]NDY57116.1 hypothetical protein [Desulfolutivibrio sulfodismutans]QLA12662.1 hypothetical protein GD606_10445 [Desulfolutivibrio sulfodismutans DSM 3696]
MSDESWPIIFSYSRTQAIEDGVLIDVTAEAKAYGFNLPFVIGDNLFSYVTPPPGLEGEGQSQEGRLHDLMSLAALSARKGLQQDRVYFEVLFLMKPGKHEKVRCVLHVGPGDHGEPVLTLCLPEDL